MNRRLLLFVIAVHLILVFSVWHSPTSVNKLPKKIVVTTKFLPKESPKAAQMAKNGSMPAKKIETAAAKEKPKPVAKKPKAKPLVKKTSPAPSPSSAKVSKAQDLLKELESSITSIESNLKKIEQKPLKDAIEEIRFDSLEDARLFNAKEDSYFEQISEIFRQSLTLPSIGAVKLSITVQPNGEIGKIETVSIKSEENFRYLETTLPHLRLPPPPKAAALCITVTFCEDQG